MKLSSQGKLLLSELEGSRRAAYQDPAGYWTIGIGHRLTRSELTSGKIRINGEFIRYHLGLSTEQIDALLMQDVERFEVAINVYPTHEFSQHQFDALVSFAFNVGVTAFRTSTLLRRLNAGDDAAVPEEMRRWIYAGGKKLPGLLARREKEIALWSGLA